MPNTPKGLPYPASTATPDVPRDLAALATATDDRLCVAGKVSCNAPTAVPGSTSAAVTFPVGMFATAPVVVCTVESGGGTPGTGMASAVTANGFTANYYQHAGAAIARTVGWHAHAETTR